jgi:hypothetical protein
MNFQSIADIYAANDEIHAGLKVLVSTISGEQARAFVEGSEWTIEQIVEHIAIVDEGASKLCSKLLGKEETAASASTSGAVTVSDNFLKHYSTINEIKLEAPERVRPTSTQTIAESLARIDENRSRLRELQSRFETTDGEAKFPHPYFGEMSAVEWLILIGGHEQRHANQIGRLLDQLSEAKK